MKMLNILLIVSIIAFVVTGCQQQAAANTPVPNNSVGNAGAVSQTTPVVADQSDNNVTVGDNPDTGDIAAPDVDTSTLS